MDETKIIIRNFTNLSDQQAVHYVLAVIKEGLISETKKGKQYCFAVRTNKNNIITCDKTKKGYTFKIFKDT